MAGGPIFLSLLAAALFWACNAIQIMQIVQNSSEWKTTDKEYISQLMPQAIEFEWKFKVNTKQLEYAIGYTKAAFWLVFILPMVELAWVLSKRGTRSLGCNVGIAVFALAGSWSKWFSTILWTGMYISFIELAGKFNLDNWLSSDIANSFSIEDEDGIGWSTLEINHWFFKGMSLIIDAIEWFLLACIFALVFFSVKEWRKEDTTTFGSRWNSLGLFLALFCLIQFLLEVVGIEGLELSWIFFILYAALFRLVLFPIWIIIMGFQLSSASTKELGSVETNELQLSEMPPASPADFTIDEDDSPIAPSVPSSPPAEAFASIGNNDDDKEFT